MPAATETRYEYETTYNPERVEVLLAAGWQIAYRFGDEVMLKRAKK